MTKLAFDDPERVLDFGPYLGFDLLELLLQGGVTSDAQQAFDLASCNAFCIHLQRKGFDLGINQARVG